ncbi:MAG: hypothetical protein IJ731_09860 [Eubacterium sp.]|nr:hypothetical protein [Eubacterium sp.]
MDKYLEHEGVGHLDGGHSGRFPWGSGTHPFQRGGDFLVRVESLKRQGLSEKQIADAFKM